MNLNQLINMFTRLVARRAMNWGINKGVNVLAGRNGSGRRIKGRNRQTQDLAQRMRMLARLIRR
nr:hypothetical protein [Paracoccus saliphilus]